MRTRRPVSRWLAAAALPIALALGGCAAPAGTVGVPAGDEPSVEAPETEDAPMPPSRSYKGEAPSACFDRDPGSFC
jgi:hypothetical protein